MAAVVLGLAASFGQEPTELHAKLRMKVLIQNDLQRVSSSHFSIFWYSLPSGDERVVL